MIMSADNTSYRFGRRFLFKPTKINGYWKFLESVATIESYVDGKWTFKGYAEDNMSLTQHVAEHIISQRVLTPTVDCNEIFNKLIYGDDETNKSK